MVVGYKLATQGDWVGLKHETGLHVEFSLCVEGDGTVCLCNVHYLYVSFFRLVVRGILLPAKMYLLCVRFSRCSGLLW